MSPAIFFSVKICSSSNKHVALQNLFLYYTWRNIKQHYKNNKPKIIAPAWNDKFKFSDGSYSGLDILFRVYHKENKTLSINPPFHTHINRINKNKK